MIRCGINDREEILSYIGKEYGKCLYLYVDLMKYGFDNPNVRLWLQKNAEGKNTALVLQYYTGMHVFSRDTDLEPAEVVELIQNNQPSMVCGMETTLTKLGEVEGYEIELGMVGQLKNLSDVDTSRCIKAVKDDTRDDIRDIADFMADDEALGKPYKDDQLYNQLVERYEQNFGRSFMIRDEETGKVIATASTYAEEAGVAVISGVMAHPDFRGQGLAGTVLSAFCKDLKKDGFDVFSYYYIKPAERLHYRVGFETIGNWAKLVRQ